MALSTAKLGVGIGYRGALHEDIIRERNQIDFLEIISDQFLYGPPDKLDRLFEAACGMPVLPHSIAMSVGTAAPVDKEYLDRNAALVEMTQPAWFSDHLCFTKVPEVDLGSLSPLWFTDDVVSSVVSNVRMVKNAIPNRLFLLENITYYFPIPSSQMTEAEFITRVLDQTDSGLLLDANNVYINSKNLGYDPYVFLRSLPLDRVVQIHIAGFQEEGDLIVDTHDSAVCQEVWSILDFVVKNSPVEAISLEWDNNFPDFSVIMDQLNQTRRILAGR